MPGIIVLAFIVIVALIIVSFAVHSLFSLWLLVAVAIVAWIKYRPAPLPAVVRLPPGRIPAPGQLSR